MKKFVSWVGERFHVDPKLVLVYIVIYLGWGFLMDWIGTIFEIAKFTYWWQVITVYVLYMVPVSLLLRDLKIHMQYAYGLIAMGLLEFAGYALQTSYAYPDNILDFYFGIRNFSLAMTLFFAWYFPLGNWAVGKIYKSVFKPG